MHFLVIFGPPAVGKMSVGREIQRVTGIRLFHNHMAIEPVLNFFPFGTPPFNRLVGEFRQRLITEVAQSELPGLSFTFVWDLDSSGDTRFLQDACEPFRKRGATIHFVELRAPLEQRLARNRSPLRLQEKPSKRNLSFSEANLLELEKLRMNTAPGEPIPLNEPHVAFDTSGQSETDVAEAIVHELALPRLAAGEHAERSKTRD